MRRVAHIAGCFVVAVLFLSGCHRKHDDAVARAYDHYLYKSDLEGLVGEGASAEDSLAIVNNYINQWIQQMVVLEKAKKNVNTNFDKELQNYKNSLVTYEYERKIIAQLLDTNVSDAEIEQYYRDHSENFMLHSNIVKSFYVKTPKDIQAKAKLRALFSRASLTDDNLVEIQKLASVYAQDYSFDMDTWQPFYQLQSAVPIEAYNEAAFLQGNKFYFTEDEESAYFVRILDYKVADQLSPLEFEYGNIRTIILNRRKIDIIKNMQRDLLKKADVDRKIERY